MSVEEKEMVPDSVDEEGTSNNMLNSLNSDNSNIIKKKRKI